MRRKRKEQIDKQVSQTEVDCTAKIQKKMRRNLVRASLNKLDKSCADKASEILKSLGSAETKVDAQQNIPEQPPQLPV